MEKIPKEWGEYTKKSMELLNVSQSELARILTKKLSRTVTQGALQARLSGPSSQPPQEPELSAWADALRLEGFHRQQFIRLALFARTPPLIRKELLAVEGRLERTEIRIKSLEKQDSDLRAQVDVLKRELAQAAAQCAQLLAKFDNA